MSTSLAQTINKWAKYIQFRLLPGTCLLCRGPTGADSDMCLSCEQSLPVIGHPCRLCALPLPPAQGTGGLCGTCLDNPPLVNHCLVPFSYSGGVATLVNDFKHHGRLSAGAWLAGRLVRKLRHYYREHPVPELIIPVPLHPSRLRRRGYNQAAELGSDVARSLGIPMDLSVCRRLHPTAAQQGLDAGQRRRNLQNAFALSPGRLADLHAAAVIDDVITTGTTCGEIARLLKHSGVAEVHLWAAARTCRVTADFMGHRSVTQPDR